MSLRERLCLLHVLYCVQALECRTGRLKGCQMKPTLIWGGSTPGSHEIKGIPAYRTVFAKSQTRENPAHPGAIIVGEIVDCLWREVSSGLERIQDPTLLPSSCNLGWVTSLLCEMQKWEGYIIPKGLSFHKSTILKMSPISVALHSS